MTNRDDRQHHSRLQRIARRAMLERGLPPDFSPQALAELDGIHGPATRTEAATRDLRTLEAMENALRDNAKEDD